MKTGVGFMLQDRGLFGPEMLEDPYPVYAQLRAGDPVHWDEPLQAWVLTRYDDVALALNDRRFSSRRVVRARDRFQDPELQPLLDTLAARMSERDEPDHKRLRALVHDAFVRTAVEQWEPRIRQAVTSLLDCCSGGGPVEFISQVAEPLPLLVIDEICGVPEQDRRQVKAWCDDFALVALNFFANITLEQMHKGAQGVAAFRAYLQERIEEFRRSPQPNLLSSLAQVELEGDGLSLDELLANALLLLAAGNETTTCLLSNGLHALLCNPQQLELLKNDPSLIPAAVEEFLRYDSPVQFLGRIVLEDTPLRDKTLRRGDLVLALLGAANRDPERFDNPDQLDVTRQHVAHFAFGHGPHFCPGAQLARLEARLAFTETLARFPSLALDATQPLRHRDNFNIRCLQELPLRLEG